MYNAFWRHALFVRGQSFSVKIFDRSLSSLRTADALPVVASLPPEGGKRRPEMRLRLAG